MNSSLDEAQSIIAEAKALKVAILSSCVKALRQGDVALQESTLFRNFSSLTEVKRFWVDFCQNPELPVENKEPTLLGSLITWHLRQLSEPLIPYATYEKILDAELGLDESNDVLSLKHFLQQIRGERWEALNLLLGLLQDVAGHSEENDLTPRALSQIFAPLLCRPANTAYMSVRHLQGLKQAEEAVMLMIQNKDEIFGNPHGMQKEKETSPHRGPLLGLSIEIPKANHFMNPNRSPVTTSRRSLTSSIDLSFLNQLITTTVGRVFQPEPWPPLVPAAEGNSVAVEDAVSAPEGDVGAGGVDVFEGQPVQVHALAGRPAAAAARAARPAGAGARRRAVAACRALRAQLGRFEDGWAARHRGRRPRGAERAPLASTYAQYRVWKRSIRDDAALQIQLYWRARRAGGSGGGGGRVWATTSPMGRDAKAKGKPQAALRRSHSNPGKLQTPLIFSGIPQNQGEAHGGGNNQGHQKLGRASEGNPKLNRSASGQLPGLGSADDDFVGLPDIHNGRGYQSESAAGGGGGASGGVLFRSGSGGGGGGSLSPTGARGVSGRGSGGGGAGVLVTVSPTLTERGGPEQSGLGQALEVLMEEKRGIKEQLKQFDLRFLQERGRMPSKAEKEPIRHLYERYNATKSRIRRTEAAMKRGGGSPWGTGPQPSSPGGGAHGRAPPPAAASPGRAGGGGREGGAAAGAGLSPAAGAAGGSPAGAARAELEKLKRAKRELHVMLKNYERQFKQQHGREVASPDDIAPVEREYQRYKEIKRRLTKLAASMASGAGAAAAAAGPVGTGPAGGRAASGSPVGGRSPVGSSREV